MTFAARSHEVPSRPFLVSFVLHAGALVALAVVSVAPRPAPRDMHAFLAMEATEPCPDLDDNEPPEVEPPEPAPPETTIEPEPEAEPEAAPPIEFERQEAVDALPMRGPVQIPAVRIPPLRHREPAAAVAAPPPARPARAEGAPVVRAALPRRDGCSPPRYPAAAQRLGQVGRVVLRVQVGADGVPTSVEVEESTGHALLDEAAVAAVRGWIFEPAREGHRAVASLVRVPFRFQLRG